MTAVQLQRSALFLAMIVFTCGCAHPSTSSQLPVRSFDDLFAEIVATDWQTEHQWSSSSPKPSPEFIAEVLEGVEMHPLDIDGDGLNEFVLCLNYSPGQKPINQTFYILRKLPGGWQLIGAVEGEPELADDDGRVRGIKPLVTTFYNGGFQYTSTRYEFRAGHYVPVHKEEWSPTGE